MSRQARYRREDGRTCIDIRVRSSRQLFDLRDPAPFRERDLDDDAEAYLLGAVREIPRREPLQIVITVSAEPEPRLGVQVLTDAVRGHFEHAREQVERRLRDQFRRGQLVLAVGLVTLFVFLTLAELTASLPAGRVASVLREGFVIMGWVALWRPVEVLLYDWWPLVDERREISRLLDAPIAIRHVPETATASGPAAD